MDSFDKIPLLTMKSLLEVFEVIPNAKNEREFEFQEKTYKIEFDWDDGFSSK